MNEIDKFCLGLIKSIAKKISGDEERHEDFVRGKP